MKIISKPLKKTADISSARGTAVNEFLKLTLSAVILLVALFFLTGFLVDGVVTRISFNTEEKLFSAFPVPGTTPAETEYQERFETAHGILDALKKGESVPPLDYSLVLMENEDPNAFAFPGGTIGITAGLLDVLSEDIEIAFVLGHEIGHFYHRDHLRGMGRAIGFSILKSTIFGGSIGSGSFGSILNQVLQRQYSQECEKKADRFGLELIHSIYGSVDGSQRLFEILKEQEKVPGWAYMLATHPSPEERIRDLEAYAGQLVK